MPPTNATHHSNRTDWWDKWHNESINEWWLRLDTFKAGKEIFEWRVASWILTSAQLSNKCNNRVIPRSVPTVHHPQQWLTTLTIQAKALIEVFPVEFQRWQRLFHYKITLNENNQPELELSFRDETSSINIRLNNQYIFGPTLYWVICLWVTYSLLT